jgi:hypothetical protein
MKAPMIFQRFGRLVHMIMRGEHGRLVTRVPLPGIRCCLAAPRPFAIITRGRSGSNFLLSLLDSHPAIRTVGEIIGEFMLRQPGIKKRILSLGAIPYVQALYRRYGFESITGAKFLYYQLEEDYGLRWGVPDSTAVLPYLLNKKDVRIIHLKRRNRLRMLASLEAASVAQQYVLNPGEQQAIQPTVTLSPRRCAEFFSTVDSHERKYDALFDEHETLEMFYEDLVEGTEEQCTNVLAFLGADPRRLRARTRKQSRRPLSEVIANYAELKQDFAGGEWEYLFEAE